MNPYEHRRSTRRTIWPGTVAGGLVGVLVALAYAVQIGAQETQTVWTGIYSEEQATRGKAAYSENCATCHMEDLRGDDAVTLAPALLGSEFLGKWDGKTLDELFTLIKTTMPLQEPGALSDDVYLDGLAFILQANRFPSGSQELKNDPETLQRVKILRTKP